MMMAYTKLFKRFAPGLLALAVSAFVVYKAAPIILNFRKELEAEVLISNFDQEAQPELAEVIEEELQVGQVTSAQEGNAERVRFRPRNRDRIVYALAYAAYNEFGARARDEASLIITRHYMRDLLREHRTLRHQDANAIIDIALYLSFLPSPALRNMNQLDQTVTFDARAVSIPSWRAWYFPFGPRGRARGQAC